MCFCRLFRNHFLWFYWQFTYYILQLIYDFLRTSVCQVDGFWEFFQRTLKSKSYSSSLAANFNNQGEYESHKNAIHVIHLKILKLFSSKSLRK